MNDTELETQLTKSAETSIPLKSYRAGLANNYEVASTWAELRQPRGYCTNMSFEGATIFSYATPIARIVRPAGVRAWEAFAMLSNRGYSTTTKTKHFPAVHRALRVMGYPQYEVEDIFANGYSGHRVNLNVMERLAIRDMVIALRARSDSKRQRHFDYAIGEMRQARGYAVAAGLKTPDDPDTLFDSETAFQLMWQALSGDPSVPPILADALEELGYDDAEKLRTMRRLSNGSL